METEKTCLTCGAVDAPRAGEHTSKGEFSFSMRHPRDYEWLEEIAQGGLRAVFLIVFVVMNAFSPLVIAAE